MKRRGKLGLLGSVMAILVLLAASCGGTTPSPSPTATATVVPTPTPTTEAMAEMPTPTPTAHVMEEPTATAMVMEEPTPTAMAMDMAHTPTPTAMAMDMEHTPTPTAMAMDMEHTPTPDVMVTPTPAPAIIGTPTPTPDSTTDTSTVQEVALIEDLRLLSTESRSTPYHPKRIVLLKDIPVRLYLTRTHREHVNEFSINPFYSSSEVILPGEVGIIEFTPDQTGKFKVLNVGHNWEMTLVVVETVDEAKKIMVENGVQELALIHSLDDSRMFPETLVVQKDVPVTIYNIGLNTDQKVSISPFYLAPQDDNVQMRRTTIIEFTPDSAGEFTILNETHEFTGTLVVEK